MSALSPPVLFISGPPGSGKSRSLVQEAIRLHVQEGIPWSGLRLLAVSSQNQARLKSYLWRELQQAGLTAPDPTVQTLAVQTLDQFILDQLNAALPPQQHWQLMSEPEFQALTAQAIQQVIGPQHPLRWASRDPSWVRVLASHVRECQIRETSPQAVLAAAASSDRLDLLGRVYQWVTHYCQQGRLLTYPSLAALALQSSRTQGADSQSPDLALLIDEAQELSAAHYQWLSQLPIRLVLSGHAQFSVRSYRGAQPQAFETFFQRQGRPVTHQVQQACLRPNAPILSLVNGLLPEPIWQEQTPDLEGLSQLVHFGYYTDADSEADALAEAIQSFVHNASVIGEGALLDASSRKARWSDCAVLLRSGRYKPCLYQAFLKRGIPFQDESLSDDLVTLRGDLDALLQVLALWEQWGFEPGHFENPSLLWAIAGEATPSSIDWSADLQRHNRSLLRWLESILSLEQQDAGLVGLTVLKDGPESTWQLSEWLDAEQSPASVVKALQMLVGLYAQWRNDRDAVGLLSSAATLLSPASLVPSDLLEGSDRLPLPHSQEAVGTLDSILERVGQFSRRLHQATGQTLSLDLLRRHWELCWQLPAPHSLRDQVRLLSVHQAQGEAFPLVMMPFLQSEEFPARCDGLEWLSPQEREALGWEMPQEDLEEWRLFALGATRANQRLMLSCHRLQETERVLPSPCFTGLLAQKRTFLGQSSTHAICPCERDGVVEQCALDGCDRLVCRTTAPASETNPAQTFQSESLWARLASQPPEPVFETSEVLSISPTAITRYMKCPRQYYYKHLLDLKESGSVAASLGNLIHKVMEVFNRSTAPGHHTPQRLQALTEIFFAFETDPEGFKNAGFGKRDRQALNELSPLGRQSLRQSLLAAIEDLSEKGYFDRYGSLQAVYAERKLGTVSLVGLERCLLEGTMDAVIQLADGRWEVVDYKTYNASKYGTRWELCEQRFECTLDPLPSEPDLPHAERFGAKLNPSYPVDYQLPLYYWACQQDQALSGGMAGVSLQLVRPPFPDNPAQGSIRLGLGAEALDASREAVLQDIQRHVIDPILGSEHFPPVPESGACGYCAYASICDQSASREGEEA